MSTNESDRPSFDATEETWFAEPRRPSRRPTQPAPSSIPPRLDDSIADGWFYDI